MSLLRWAANFWRNLLRGDREREELGEELDAYVELLVEERVKEGLSPTAARRAAMIAVGSLDGVKEDVQAVRAGAFAESVLLDARYALRALRRSPVFTATAVLVLALGIGANALVFGVIDTVFLRGPAHVRDPGRVARVALVATIPGEGVFTTIVRTYRDYESLRDRGTAFSSVAAFATMQIVVGQGAAAEEVSATVATHTFFPLLGVQPRLGRFYGADEDRPGGPPVAVLGYGYWCRRYGCAPTVLGQTLLVRGRPYTIVGVAPQGFTGVALEAPDAWLPVATAGPDVFDYGGAISGFLNAWLVLVVRLKPGVSTALAEQVAVAAVRGSGDDAQVGGGGRQYRVQLYPIQESRGPTRRPEALVLVWVGAVSVLILLIACANVASLLLTRALNRQREIAVRLVLGIPRRRLVQQLVVESVILAAIGASAGSLIVLLGGPAFRRLALGGVVAAQPFGTWRLLLFVTTLTLATGLATGLVPGLQATRGNLTASLGSGVREVGRRYARTLRGLLLAQVALSFVLLVMAGLFVQSLRAAQRIDLGLDTQGLLSIKLDVRPDGLPRPETRAAYQRLLVFVETLPLVQHAALAASEPLGASMSVGVRLPGRRVASELERSSQYVNLVSQD